MQVGLYRLTFPTGFHLAPHELSLDQTLPTIPSDTLFSALVHSWAHAGGDPQAWLAPFLQGDPPFLISSAFPWVCRKEASQNGQKERVIEEPWFPKPLAFRPAREWKEVQFLPEALFLRAAKGGLPEKPSKIKAWEIEQVPRVSLDRVSLRSNLFYLARVYFAPGCGLWFAVAWRNPDLLCGNMPFRKALELALSALAETGIGGDRSVGYGRFTWEHLDDVVWPDPAPQGYGVLLSRLWPQGPDLALLARSAAWRFVEVGGFAETAEGHVRRLRVRLVVEGSVVPTGVRGGFVDLAPPHFRGHPIWRYGLAFLFPWEVAHAA